METPGIMDSVLQPYLKAITLYYKETKNEKWSFLHASSPCEGVKKETENLRREKLDNVAQTFRQQGNAFFKALDFTQALELYTKSISAAKDGPLACLTYFNRSAALFQMKLYEDCIKDIDRALVAGYPEQHNLYNLYLRKSQCLKFLNKNYEGCLAKAMRAIKDLNSNNKAKMRLSKLVSTKMEEPEPVFNKTLPKPNESWKLPELSYGQNPEVPCFSSAIDLVHSNKLGRHITANRDINTGDVLIVEESILTSTYCFLRWNFCNFCFKHCNSLIPGKSCGYLMYCSENCRDSDQNAEHKIICSEKHHPTSFKHFKLDEAPITDSDNITNAIVSLVFGLCKVLGLDNIKQTVLENKPVSSLLGDPRTRGFQNGKFQQVTLEALFSLDDGKRNINLDSSSMFGLRMCDDFDIPPDQLLPLGAFFSKLYHIVTYYFKPVDCYKVNYKVEAGLRKLSVGLGMFLASSLVNSSCDANMYRIFYGNSIVFRAKRPIKKGEQLTDSEHDIPVAEFYQEQRQLNPLNIHKMNCSCLACLDPSSTTLEGRPLFPMQNMTQCFLRVGLDSCRTNGWKTWLYIQLMHCCASKFPATKQMLPKMLALLQSLHVPGKKSNRFYFELQECIQNHFRTEGNCIFYGDAIEILSGEIDYGKQ